MSSILDRKRFGAVLRVFSKDPEQVPRNVEQVLESAFAIDSTKIDGHKFSGPILILVAADSQYVDHDCGLTIKALRRELKPGGRIEAHAIRNGDLFCGVPNNGVGRLCRQRCDYAFFMSHGARSFLTEDILRQMVEALKLGAKVTGVAIPEIAQSVMEGRIANTFAIWEILSLITVGGFNPMAAQPELGTDHDTSPYLRGWTEEEDDLFYSSAGVEEIAPLACLVKNFRECIAPIPAPEGAVWQEPDLKTDPKGYWRSRDKLESKSFRQDYHLGRMGYAPNYLKRGVMRSYRPIKQVL